MTPIIISLIVPVYNVETYLKQCLSSLIADKDDKIEILLINDASTDGSLKICRQFHKRDSRINLINLEKNKGSGFVRNLGIQKAKGNYIWFIDSDDWIESNAIQKLLDFISKDNYDIIYFGTQKVGIKKKIVLPEFKKHYPTFFNDGLKTLKGIHPMVWCSLFSRSFLIRNKITFPEGIYLQDVPFSAQAQYYSKKIGGIKELLYNYRIHEASITQSPSKKKIDDSFTAHFKIRDFLKEQNVFEQYKKDFIIRLLSCCILPCFVDYLKMPKTQKDEELKNFMKQVRKSDLLSSQNLFLLKEASEKPDSQEKKGDKFFKRAYSFLLAIRHTYWLFLFHFKFFRLFHKEIKQIYRKK